MTVEQAIKLQEQLLTLLPEVGFDKYMRSTRLGIEALREARRFRQMVREDQICLLPGETKE